MDALTGARTLIGMLRNTQAGGRAPGTAVFRNSDKLPTDTPMNSSDVPPGATGCGLVDLAIPRKYRTHRTKLNSDPMV